MIGPRTLAGVVLLFVFSLGVVAGIAFERHHLGSGGAASPADEHAAAMGELRDVVGLDERQLQQVHAILAERQEVVQQLWEQLRPEVQEAMQDVHSEIAELLRPDQVKRFHDWLSARGGRHAPMVIEDREIESARD